MMRQVKEWKRRAAEARRELDARERQIVDMAKRLSRLEAEADYHDRAAQRRRQQ